MTTAMFFLPMAAARFEHLRLAGAAQVALPPLSTHASFSEATPKGIQENNEMMVRSIVEQTFQNFAVVSI